MNWLSFLKHYKSIKISKPAELDLKNIANYTLSHWGELQKQLYLGLFKELFINLREDDANPALIKIREDIDEDLLSFRVRKHVVYFRITAKEVLILRVLHSSMDPEKHLEG